MTRLLLLPIVALSVAIFTGCAATAPDAASTATAPASAPSETTPPAPTAPVTNSASPTSATPSSTPTADAAPVINTEGFGDVRLGQKIPANSTTAGFNKKACDGGGAITLLSTVGTENDINIVTKDRTLKTAVFAIITYEKTFATKSGIHVGDSLAKVTSTYGSQLTDAGSTGSIVLRQVRGNAGRVVFQFEKKKVAAIAIVKNDNDSGSFIGTDAFSPCGVA
jgi:hypothetical protein